MSPVKRVLVLGGNGFVGKEVCKKLFDLGLKVTSLSRRGRPTADYLSAKDMGQNAWVNKIDWRAGSAVNIEGMSILVNQADCVIHCIGILVESAINRYVSGSRSYASETTFETSNRDTALVALSQIEKGNKGLQKPFIFISADSAPPFMPRYLSTKREVEQKMEDLSEKNIIRSVIFRPGILYHESRWTTLPVSRLVHLGCRMDTLTSKVLGFRPLGFTEPTALDLLSMAVCQAAVTPGMQGIFGNKEMWDMTVNQRRQARGE